MSVLSYFFALIKLTVRAASAESSVNAMVMIAELLIELFAVPTVWCAIVEKSTLGVDVRVRYRMLAIPAVAIMARVVAISRSFFPFMGSVSFVCWAV